MACSFLTKTRRPSNCSTLLGIQSAARSGESQHSRGRPAVIGMLVTSILRVVLINSPYSPRLARELYAVQTGSFDDEAIRVEPIENPFGPKVLPMCPERTTESGGVPCKTRTCDLFIARRSIQLS